MRAPLWCGHIGPTSGPEFWYQRRKFWIYFNEISVTDFCRRTHWRKFKIGASGIRILDQKSGQCDHTIRVLSHITDSVNRLQTYGEIWAGVRWYRSWELPMLHGQLWNIIGTAHAAWAVVKHHGGQYHDLPIITLDYWSVYVVVSRNPFDFPLLK